MNKNINTNGKSTSTVNFVNIALVIVAVLVAVVLVVLMCKGIIFLFTKLVIPVMKSIVINLINLLPFYLLFCVSGCSRKFKNAYEQHVKKDQSKKW